MIFSIEQPIYTHSLYIRKKNRKNNVHIFYGYKILTDFLFPAHDMSCKIFAFNWKLSSGWASNTKRKNVSQAPRKDFGLKKVKIGKVRNSCVMKKLEVIVVSWKIMLDQFEKACSMYKAKWQIFQNIVRMLLKFGGRVFVHVGLAYNCPRHF